MAGGATSPAIFDSSILQHKTKDAYIKLVESRNHTQLVSVESNQEASLTSNNQIPESKKMSAYTLPSTHIALLPSSGMGHLTPFVRLAASIAVQDVHITFIAPYPTVSLAESETLSRLFASFPQINPKYLHLTGLNEPRTSSEDPFYRHMEGIRQSSHLLLPLLSSLYPPLTALVTDMSLAAAVAPITQALRIHNYVLFTTSARMLTLFLSYHTMVDSKELTDADVDVVKLPDEELIPKSWIPPLLLEKTNNLTKSYFIDNGKKMVEASGILVNTFESFEQESLSKLNDGRVVEKLPSVIAIGPLLPCEFEKSQPLAWLDGQPTGSVVYVSFGSRTAMSREQLKELGEGLVRCGYKFLWAVKGKKVDREDDEELDKIIGEGLMVRVKEKGLVVKQWLSQDDVLGHPAVGAFLSHCGWNSVTETVRHGVPILAWPQHGDQRMNADVVDRTGIGMWVKSWGWGGEMVVSGEEIAGKIKETMRDESLRVQAIRVKQDARAAVADGGSSHKKLSALIHSLNL